MDDWDMKTKKGPTLKPLNCREHTLIELESLRVVSSPYQKFHLVLHDASKGIHDISYNTKNYSFEFV